MVVPPFFNFFCSRSSALVDSYNFDTTLKLLLHREAVIEKKSYWCTSHLPALPSCNVLYRTVFRYHTISLQSDSYPEPSHHHQHHCCNAIYIYIFSLSMTCFIHKFTLDELKRVVPCHFCCLKTFKRFPNPNLGLPDNQSFIACLYFFARLFQNEE